MRFLGILSLVFAILVGCSGTNRALPPNPSLTEIAAARLQGLTAQGGAAPAALDPAQLRAAVTPEFLSQLQTPTLFVVLNDAVSLPQRITASNGVETYLTEDNITLALRAGMVIATRGLGFDIMESDVAEPLAAVLDGGQRATRSHAWLDGEGRILRRSFDCTYSQSESEVRETCYALGLEFENTYSVRNGRITVSRQWLGPILGSISIEQLTF